MTVDMIGIFAGLAVFWNDIIALASVVLCMLSLGIGIYNLAADAGFSKNDRFFVAGVMSLVVGGISQIVLLSKGGTEVIGFVFRLPVEWVNLIFVVAGLLVVCRLLLPKFIVYRNY